MPKTSNKKPKKSCEKIKASDKDKVISFLKDLTEQLKEVIDEEPKLRNQADELSEVMTSNYDEDSATVETMTVALRVLMVTDTIANEEIEIKEVSDMMALLALTAETVFGLSHIEALLLGKDLGEQAFEVYEKSIKDLKKENDTPVYKTIFLLTTCLDSLKEDKESTEN